MAPTTFTLFSSLPLELREEIYMLATPPRVVHMREHSDEDFDEFREGLRSKLSLDLSPELLHFAFNWGRHVPRRTDQSTLEGFGFSSDKPRYMPWDVSPSAPEIHMSWLLEHPVEAWQFARKYRLYTDIGIPALLHTCSESRASLKRRGYELAFQTRSSEPRTWFNFSRDTLYIKYESADGHGEYPGGHVLMSGSSWGLGRFSPKDLLKIENIALEHGASFLASNHPLFPLGGEEALSMVARLCGNVKKLFLVEWSEGIIDEYCLPEDGMAPEKHAQSSFFHENSSPEPWVLTNAEEIDDLPQLESENQRPFHRPGLTAAGDFGERLISHQEMDEGEASFLQDMEFRLEQRMVELRSTKMATERTFPIIPWNVPKLAAVHLTTERGLKLLAAERARVLGKLQEVQREWACITSHLEGSPESIAEWKTKEKEFADKYWPEVPEPCCGQCEGAYFEEQSRRQQVRWWIQEGSRVPVRNYQAS